MAATEALSGNVLQYKGYRAEILVDSVSPKENRLTTSVLTFPRIVLPEFNTHRQFSRNVASSRAMPVAKMLGRMLDDPFDPEFLGKNEPGMVANALMSEENQATSLEIIRIMREVSVLGTIALNGGIEMTAKSLLPKVPSEADHIAVAIAEEKFRDLTEKYRLMGIAFPQLAGGEALHKQNANRYVEPYAYTTAIVTATQLSNFFALRIDSAAQPEINKIAEMWKEVYDSSSPTKVAYKEWHLPYVTEEDRELVHEMKGDDPIEIALAKLSVARCARVSYLTHEGTRDVAKDINLYEQLVGGGHMSPLEHAARPFHGTESRQKIYRSNLVGWMALRKLTPNESDFSVIKLVKEMAEKGLIKENQG